MKEFYASPDFVSKVMKRIHKYEKNNITTLFIFKRIAEYKSFRFALAFGGIFLGLCNIFSLFLAVFIPVTCG